MKKIMLLGALALVCNLAYFAAAPAEASEFVVAQKNFSATQDAHLFAGAGIGAENLAQAFAAPPPPGGRVNPPPGNRIGQPPRHPGNPQPGFRAGHHRPDNHRPGDRIDPHRPDNHRPGGRIDPHRPGFDQPANHIGQRRPPAPPRYRTEPLPRPRWEARPSYRVNPPRPHLEHAPHQPANLPHGRPGPRR